MIFYFNFLKKYDVALSFAEEDRAFVSRVAFLLKEKGVKVFYDDYERARSWGEDLKYFLAKVYGKHSRFCLIFISRHYDVKQWTKFESGIVKAVAFLTNKKPKLLAFRLDNSYSEVIAPEIAYLSSETRNEQQLVDTLIQKLDTQLPKRMINGWKQFSASRWRMSAMVTILVVVFGFALADHLTPVDVLTRSIYNRNTHNIKGSQCRDSTFSKARGRGACAHHRGVAYPKDSLMHNKTIEACEKEARESSWLD